jgi:ELWxxDGT repeat protein
MILKRVLLPTIVGSLQLLSFAAFAAEPILVADFAPGTFEEPLQPQNLAAIDGLVYFSAFQSETGREPWVSDGTAAGTRLLADLCPGSCSSSPQGFADADGLVLFVTTDGTTITVRKLAAGQISTAGVVVGNLGGATAQDGYLYFAVSSAGANSLWVSGGTPIGTRSLAELCSGPFCGPGLPLIKTEVALYFSILNGASITQTFFRLHPGLTPTSLYTFEPYWPGVVLVTELDSIRTILEVGRFNSAEREIWIYDRSSERFEVINTGPASLAQPESAVIAWRGRAYYVNPLGQVVSASGTTNDLIVAPISGNGPGLLAANTDSLFYSVANGDGSRSLRALRSNLSTHLLLTGFGSFSAVARFGERWFFTQNGKLWVSDGTPAGTVALPDLLVGSVAIDGNRLFFAGAPSASGISDLWTSDGTAGGTFKVASGAAQARSSAPVGFGIAGQLLVDPKAAGDERRPWRVDPTTLALTQLDPRPLTVLAGSTKALLAEERGTLQGFVVKAEGASALPVATIDPRIGIAPDDTFFFTDHSDGIELWQSDGTVAGTRELFDLQPDWQSGCSSGNCSELPAHITPTLENVFFLGPPAEAERTFDLWVHDRRTGARRALARPESNPGYLDGGIVAARAVGRWLVFLTAPPNLPGTLWLTDGSRPPAAITQFPEPLKEWVTIGERLFLTTSGTIGDILYFSDLTFEGSSGLLFGAAIDELTAVGDQVYFRFLNNQGEAQVGFSDGTIVGSGFLAFGENDQSGQNPQNLFAVDNQRLVFSAATTESGAELWISDGTTAGTSRLTDLVAGAGSSAPSDFIEIDNRLFFQAFEPAVGRELWALDLGAARSPCPADKLCFYEGRFEVEVKVTVDGFERQGQRAFGNAESGVFTFFDANNWEFLVKVLNGCPINDHFWVYASAATDVAYELKILDRDSGATRVYTHPGGQAARPILDSSAFPGCSWTVQPRWARGQAPAPVARRCADDLKELCLSERFRVEVEWQTANGNSGKARAVASGSADSGLFTFFSASNWELMVKVLDGCSINDRHWVFAAGTTDVAWTMKVTDERTGEFKIYHNPQGQPSLTITDSNALGGCG